MNITFFVHGTPKAQPRPRAFAINGKARMYDAGTAEGWKGAVALAGRACKPETPLEGPMQVDIDFFMPRPKKHYRTGKRSDELREDAPEWHAQKPDRDNMEKAVLDALTVLGFWKDDGQVCCGSVTKKWAASDKSGAQISITW